MNIKVMGPGCPKCEQAEQIVKSTLNETGIDAVVEKVSDFAEIAKHGVFSTPAVMVDDEIKCVGRVPTKKEMLTWLQE